MALIKPIANYSGEFNVIESGDALDPTCGGTGQTVYAVGDLLYASTTTALARLAAIGTGNVLTSSGVGTAPTWGKVNLDGIIQHVSGNLPLANMASVAANSIFANATAAAATPTAVAFAVNTFPARASTGNLAAKAITDFALTILADTVGANVLIGKGSGALTEFAVGIAQLVGRTTSAPLGVINMSSLPISTATQAALDLKANLAAPPLTGAATLNSKPIGFNVSTANLQNNNYTILAASAGTTILYTSSGLAGSTWTISPDSSGTWPIGSMVQLVHNGSNTAVTIARGSGVTLNWIGGGGADGNRTLGITSSATIWQQSANVWCIWGNGLT